MTTLNNTNSELIGKFINEYLYTDVNPIGKIVGLKGKTTILVKEIEAERDLSVEMKFVEGGFAGHCYNQYEQKWFFKETERITEMRISKKFLRWFKIENEPRKFYDFNF